MAKALVKLVALITPKRRWAQFSLKSLLVLVVVVAVTCGWLKSKMDRKEARSRAIEAIDRLGGTYAIRLEGSKKLQTLAKWLGYDERIYYDIRRVSLGPSNSGYDPSKPVGDKELESLTEHLALFTNMHSLYLQDPAISNRGVAALPPLPNLNLLNVTQSGVSDGIADALERFPALASLDLRNTAVTEEGVKEIRRRLPNCKVEY